MTGRKKIDLKALLVDGVILIFAPAVVAAGLVMFTVPNNIAPGGVSGLATALAYVTPLSVGLWTLVLNVPLVLLAWRRLGLRPLVKTIVATLLLSLYLSLLEPLLPGYTNNVLLAAVLGGVLSGIGMGALFVRGASTGGTDLATLMLNRLLPNASLGTLLMSVDALVVIFAVFVFRDLEVALYSIVTIYVTTKVIDSITQGVDYAKVIYVVTERGDEINRVVAGDMGCGVTVLNGHGGFTGRDKQVLMVVIRRSLFSQTLQTIKLIDGAAFLYVINATEVHGEGFKPMS